MRGLLTNPLALEPLEWRGFGLFQRGYAYTNKKVPKPAKSTAKKTERPRKRALKKPQPESAAKASRAEKKSAVTKGAEMRCGSKGVQQGSRSTGPHKSSHG